MVERSPVPCPARFDARKLVLLSPALVCAKDEMSVVLFFFSLKATVHEVDAFYSSADGKKEPTLSYLFVCSTNGCRSSSSPTSGTLSLSLSLSLCSGQLWRPRLLLSLSGGCGSSSPSLAAARAVRGCCGPAAARVGMRGWHS